MQTEIEMNLSQPSHPSFSDAVRMSIEHANADAHPYVHVYVASAETYPNISYGTTAP